MNPNVYQAAAARTEADPCKSASRMESMLPVDPNCPDSLHLMPVRVNHAIVGLAGEVGELAQLLERWVYYGQSLSIPDVEEEVGDCLWYLALLCNAVGIPMERAMEGNLAKLKARFPHKFTEEAAANRDPTAERKALDEAMERAKAEWVSAYADGLKDLTEQYGGVSSKPVSEIYPPSDERTKDDEKMKRYAVQYGAVGKAPPVPKKPIDLPGAPQPGVVLLGGIPVPGVWACECGQINADCRLFCGCCNKRRKGQEDWLCECGHINLAVDPRCVKCEKPRLATIIREEDDYVCPSCESEDHKNCDSRADSGTRCTCRVCYGEEKLRSVDPSTAPGRPPDQENPFGYDEAGEIEDM